MGSYDLFHFVGDVGEMVPRCAVGHECRDGLQTKDLDCVFGDFYVRRYNGKLLVFGGDGYGSYLGMADGEPQIETRWTIDGGMPLERSPILHPMLVRTTVERMRFRFDLDGGVRVYTHCRECPPLVSRSKHGLGDHEPRCEWVLVFGRGVLLRVEPFRLQTRDELRRELVDRFRLDVLDDADPEAAQRIAEHASRKREK